MILLNGGVEKFELSFDKGAVYPILRLMPHTTASMFQIGNPSNASGANTDYIMVSEPFYGNVMLGPGLPNGLGELPGATSSRHKVQLKGDVYISGSNKFDFITNDGVFSIIGKNDSGISINASTGVTSYARSEYIGGGGGYIDFSDSSATDYRGRIIYYNATDEFNFITYNQTNRLKIFSDGVEVQNGALGVGVAPNATDGRIDAANDVVAYSSDKRLKTNIQPIENPLEKVLSLEGFIYNWNELAKEVANFNTEEKLVGVFAQDIQRVLPEAVKLAPFDNDGTDTSKSGENYLTVQYEKIVPLLIEAIKEQQNQINELKKIIQNGTNS